MSNLDLVRAQRQIAAIPTPFQTRGKERPYLDTPLDVDTFRQLILFQLLHGNAPLIIGTTGESPTTTPEEEEELCGIARETIDDGGHPHIPLIVGAGSNSTKEAVKYTQAAVRNGANGILSVAPYYNKPTQQGFSEHFKWVADSADGNPVIAYNIPGRTGGGGIFPETLARLHEDHANIIGVKECNPAQLTPEVISAYPKDFRVWTGNDESIVENMEAGVFGAISVLMNVDPQETKEMIRLAGQGDFEKSRAILETRQKFIGMLFEEGNPAGVKGALQLLGFGNNETRLPMKGASKELLKKMEEEMRALELIKS